jgi:hypothetical protein
MPRRRRPRWFHPSALLLAAAAQSPGGARAQPADDAPAPDQVLVIPLAGDLPAPWTDAPASLTRALERAVTAIGAEPVAAAVGRSDITAITGCPAESDDCFREVASTIEVDRLVFGSVEPTADNAGLGVSLTLIRREGALSRRRVELASGDPDAAAVEFEPHARAFLLGEEPPAPPAPDLAVSAPVAAQVERPARFALGRVEKHSWALAGGGVALAAVGVVLWFGADAKQDEVDRARVDTPADLERLVELEEDGRRLTTWGNVLVIGGGLVAVAGAALVVKQGLERPAPAAAAPAVALTPLGQGVAVTMVGRF